MSEFTMKYNLKVVYIPGSHPWSTTQPIVKDTWGKDTPVEAIVRLVTLKRYQRKFEDLFLTTINDLAMEDLDYMTVLEHLKKRTPIKILRKEPIGSPVHSYLNVWDRLGILEDKEGSLMTIDNNRLVVPKKY